MNVSGHDLFLWIGRAVSPAILHTLLNVQSLDGVDMSLLKLHSENSDFSSRVNAVVEGLRADRSRHMQLHMIREGDGYAEAFFARYLMEDRANFNGGTFSYQEVRPYLYLCLLYLLCYRLLLTTYIPLILSLNTL